MEQIYVVEDDDNIRDLIQIALNGFGYQVKAFETAEEALLCMETETPILVLMDLMLPGMDGLSAIKKIRSRKETKEVPVIILTAKDKELDKIVGLDGGADDYMTKPFSIMELSARIRSLLRRTAKKDAKQECLEETDICLYPKTREVTVSGAPVELTLKEYELLLYLMENKSKVVMRDELLNKIWGYDYDGETRTLDIHIRTLRQKLGAEGSSYIKTIRGVGYRFVKPQEI